VALALAFGIPSLVALGHYKHTPWWAVVGLIAAAGFALAALFFFVAPLLAKRASRPAVPTAPPAEDDGQPRPPLVVTILEDSKFISYRRIALIAALHVQVENTTDEPIQAAGYIYTTDTEGAPTWDQVASQEDGLAVEREVARLEQSQEYGQPLRHYLRIPARTCVSGWMLFAVNRDPAGGTPACTVGVRDSLGNIYSETLPKSRPRIYGPIQDWIGYRED
jgi:hypothetical protein